MKKAITRKAWAFQFSDGMITLPVKATRKELISHCEIYFATNWKKITKHGHRAVKVEIKVID